MKPVAVREQWGVRHFRRSPAELAESLPLRAADRELLCDTGLPVGPKKTLTLSMRFEDVEIRHQPQQLRLVTGAGLQKGKTFPKTGHKDLDRWADLGTFVVIGEAPGTFFPKRLVCVDGIRGHVWWVYPKLAHGRTDCDRLNTGLATYLESLLAYKEFRGEWSELLKKYANPVEAELDREDKRRGRAIHRKFLRRLGRADPHGFEDGFWFCHAWDEAILLEG
jgi:hypothetical protein